MHQCSNKSGRKGVVFDIFQGIKTLSTDGAAAVILTVSEIISSFIPVKIYICRLPAAPNQTNENKLYRKMNVNFAHSDVTIRKGSKVIEEQCNILILFQNMCVCMYEVTRTQVNFQYSY